jgi:NhaA family Na+:H+ antiporter
VGLLCGGLYTQDTVTGVLLAFVIPFGNGDKDSTSSVLQHFLHKPVGFDTSSFALANTAIVVSSNIGETIAQHYSIGIALG